MDNITKVHFNPDEDYIWDIQGLEQWDKCQKLEISGLDISDEIVEVHFSLDQFQGNAERMYGTVKDGVIHADIPVFILEGSEYLCSNSEVYNAYAWVYVSDEESAETIRKMEFEIKARPKPNGYASPDKQDPFLQEIRQVLTDTKQIAQSVRDDADNGVFNGEQGPKGDAGSIEFKIVNELPTENINESAMYLVPLSPGSEQNEFAEYIYVNGHWEYIGSASVEVDLSEYVKNTDYATQGDVKTKTDNTRFLTSKYIDLLVREGLANSKLEWTDEEKAKALKLLGGLQVQTPEFDSGATIGYVYFIDTYGNQVVKKVQIQSNADTIPLRNPNGNFYVSTPTLQYECANKGYVDDLFGTYITDIASLVGGDA